MFRIIVFLYFLFFLKIGIAFGQVKKDIANTIVRVKSGSKISTGFFWKDGNTIVTTLHGLADKNNVSVFVHTNGTTGRWFPATIERTLMKSDLVILRAESASRYFLTEILENPPVDTDVFTVGYNGSIPNFLDKDFVIGLSQGGNLQDILPEKAKNEIRNLRFPSLTTKILYLKGSLIHGFSGSPIVDQRGRLVGVSNGGLENGASSISWCMPSSYVLELENSNELPPSSHQALNASILFSGNDEMSEDFLIFKDFKFQKMKTRTFDELSRTANYSATNELGFEYLLNSLKQGGILYDDFSYDIYTEVSSGATIAVPSGLDLFTENGRLVGRDGSAIIYIAMEEFSDINVTTNLFLNELNMITGKRGPNFGEYSWLNDDTWSYSRPFYRIDGTSIHRASFHCFVQDQYFTPLFNDYLFRVFASKRNVFLGYYVIMNRSIYLGNNGKIQYLNPEMHAKYHLAAHLTTFSFN
ncbi:hypothetical protein GCM10009119_24190 [Algoriphagus jejuensis]|uniref:Trypsin-like peptidase n=1 Tax=Algoriphagus jejuensis TaxID=419934 RepID=A0ABN1N0X6_9BACT